MDKKLLSKKHEKFIAEKFEGKVQMASGAIWFAKADVYTDKFLIECKATEKDYYVLKSSILDKIESEALKVGKIPLLCFRIKDKWGNYLDYVCVGFNYVEHIYMRKGIGYTKDMAQSTILSKVILGTCDEAMFCVRRHKIGIPDKRYVICGLDFFIDYVEESIKW